MRGLNYRWNQPFLNLILWQNPRLAMYNCFSCPILKENPAVYQTIEIVNKRCNIYLTSRPQLYSHDLIGHTETVPEATCLKYHVKIQKNIDHEYGNISLLLTVVSNEGVSGLKVSFDNRKNFDSKILLKIFIKFWQERL